MKSRSTMPRSRLQLRGAQGSADVITVFIQMRARPEKRREFIQTILAMTEPARKQKGCLSRHLYQDTRDEDSFVMLEEWESKRDLDHHVRSDWFHILLGTRNLLQEEPVIKLSSLSYADLLHSVGLGLGSIDL